MKRIIISLAVLVSSTFGVLAQSSLVATLAHGDNVTYYYGESALGDAYNAALDGDCIILSPGTFTAVSSIEKAITIRGAGMRGDVNLGTTLYGTFEINIADKRSFPVVIESVQCYCRIIKGALEQEVHFIKVSNNEDLYLYSCSPKFIQSIIGKVVSTEYNENGVNNVYAYFDNCVVYLPCNGENNGSGYFFQNCVIGSTVRNLYRSSLSNCIIIGWDGNYHSSPLNTTNCAECCVGMVTYSYADPAAANHFSNMVNTTNRMVTDASAFFKTCNTSYDFGDYQLTDAAQTEYKGNDDTQVGLYGGANPLNFKPMNPQVTKFAVSTTTESGILKVKINVE